MKKRLVASKIVVPVIVALAAVSRHAYDDDSLADLLLEISGYSLLVIAVIGRIWTSAFISGWKRGTLVTVGPYSIVRNPLYFFSFLAFVGAGLAFESIVLAVVFGCLFFLTHWKAILDEERHLRLDFGDRYEEYFHTVPRFIPKLSRFSLPEEITLKPRVFSRAVADCALIGLIYPFAHLLEWAQTYCLVHWIHWIPLLRLP